MQTITLPSFKNITKTYCGLGGCACGCGGTYVAPTHADVDSYTPRNNRTVKMRLTKVIKAYEANPSSVSVFPGFGNEMIWEYVYGTYSDHNALGRVVRIYATKEEA